MSPVRIKREQLGISLTELAQRTGFSLVKLSRIEHAHRKIQIEDLRILARELKCSIDDLVPAEAEKASANV